MIRVTVMVRARVRVRVRVISQLQINTESEPSAELSGDLCCHGSGPAAPVRQQQLAA